MTLLPSSVIARNNNNTSNSQYNPLSSRDNDGDNNNASDGGGSSSSNGRTTALMMMKTTKTTHNQQDDREQFILAVSPRIDHDSTTALTLTVDEAIERLGMGSFQLWILVASGICFAAGGIQIQMLFFLGPIFQQEWNLTNDETAGIESIVFIGQMTGALVLGPIADKVGRRIGFLISATCITIFGVSLSMFQDILNSYSRIVPIVFMIGMGVGGLTVPFDILAEFLPSQWRGKILLIIGYFWTIGILFVVGIASQTLLGNVSNDHVDDVDGHSSSRDDWRRFAMICSLPCPICILLGWWLVPESPRWLCTQGRYQDALDILRHASHMNNPHDVIVLEVDENHVVEGLTHIFPEGTQLVESPEWRENPNHRTKCFDLLAPKWRWTMIRLWCLWGTMSFGYYVTVMATTKIFASTLATNSVSPTTTKTTTTIPPFDYGALFISSSAEFLGSTLVIGLVDSVGRIPVQVICFALAGICVSILCILASHHEDDDDDGDNINYGVTDSDMNGLVSHHRRTVLLIFGFMARVFEMAASCVTWVSTADILTTDIRTTGHSTANAMARIGGMLGPFLVEDTNLMTMGIVMLMVRGISVFCVSGLPETKGSHHMGIHITTSTVPQQQQQQRTSAAVHIPTTIDTNSPTIIPATTELVGVLEATDGEMSLLNDSRK